jgi:hypothetical protein
VVMAVTLAATRTRQPAGENSVGNVRGTG